MIYQVNRIVKQSYATLRFLRNLHGAPSARTLYPLESRKLVKIAGADASAFLQGLITNDMRHLEDGAASMYAMFLNNKGRVLFDTLIHRWNNEDSYLLECDKHSVNRLQKHLKLFKLKRKITIEDVNDGYRLWVLVTPSSADLEPVDSSSQINVYKDPRLAGLGFRVVAPAAACDTEVASELGNDVNVETSEEGYKYLRYRLG